MARVYSLDHDVEIGEPLHVASFVGRESGVSRCRAAWTARSMEGQVATYVPWEAHIGDGRVEGHQGSSSRSVGVFRAAHVDGVLGN